MLEFKITQELKPNPKLLELIKDFTYKTKKGKELINRLISSIEITRDDNYNIEIKIIKFTEEFISEEIVLNEYVFV